LGVLEDFGNILKEIVKNSEERRGCVVGWAMHDFKSERPILLATQRKAWAAAMFSAFRMKVGDSLSFTE
jgi:hypothetical protein